jgi:DNA-binding MarR family transcriptional regulator
MTNRNQAEPQDLPRERLLQAQACTNRRLRRAERALNDFYDSAMAPSGLHSNQFSLLTLPYLKPGLTITQLAQLTGLDRTTLARNLDLLERRRLVTLRAGEDQRTRVIEVSDLGRQALARALPLWERAQQQVSAALGDAQVHALYGHLDTLEGLSGTAASRS